MDISGKTVLITGGTSGIGLGIAEILAEKGATIIMTYAKNDERAKSAVKTIFAYGVQAYTIKADSGDQQSRERLMKKCESIGQIDVLINNVGSSIPSVSGYSTREGMFHHHMMSTVILSEWFNKQLGEKQGAIVNITSILGTEPLLQYKGARLESYCCIKSAVNTYTRLSANKYKGIIRVNAVAPGNTMTSGREGADESFMQKRKEGTLIGRFIEPKEIGLTVSHIIENEAINGHIFSVDGGVVARGYE